MTERSIDKQWSAEVRCSPVDALTRVVESFSGSLDLREVIREIVTATLDAFKADRAWLLHPANLTAEFAAVAFEATTPGNEGAFALDIPIPLESSRALLDRAIRAAGPIILFEDDADMDPFIRERFRVRSEILQILRPGEGEPWAFGMHQCDGRREWTPQEIGLFRRIGRFATLALNNALVHDHATRDAARMNAILDQIPEAAAIYSTDGRLERMNRAAERNRSLVFGPTLAARLEKSHLRYTDGTPVPLDDLPVMRGLRGETSQIELVCADARGGEDRIVNIHGTPVRDDEEHIIGSLILCRDVTDERASARREVEARGRFEAVLESAPIGIAVISADELRFELANPLWVEYASRFGKIGREDRVIGLRVADVIPGLEPLLREVAEQGEPVIDEALEILQGRHTWYLKRIISPVRGRLPGAPQSLTVLLQDVTVQVLTNSEVEALAKLMEERSARLDSILGSMTDALWVYDVAGNVLDVNPAALAMFGLGSRKEARARGRLTDFEFHYPDGSEIPLDDMPYARALRGEVVPDYLASAKQLITGITLDLSIAAAPIQSDGIVGAVLVIRDITQLQELDRKKDEFLSVASHELRTPLTTIKGYTQLLAQGGDAVRREDRELFLEAVLGEIERMMGLISELLDVSRIETRRLEIHPQPTDWVEFVRRQVDNFRLQNPDREMRFETNARRVDILIDVDRMRQVIDNLLSNALKYSAEKSPIEMIVDVGDREVVTAVVDHGIGIPRDEIPQLFERFHRARNVSSRYYGGLGLGLYIARAIVEEHDGEIRIESEEGSGSRVTIRLPRG